MHWQDAMVAFEGALNICPDYCSAYNLAVMAYALGEPDNMKSAFLTLIQVRKQHTILWPSPAELFWISV